MMMMMMIIIIIIIIIIATVFGNASHMCRNTTVTPTAIHFALNTLPLNSTVFPKISSIRKFIK